MYYGYTIGKLFFWGYLIFLKITLVLKIDIGYFILVNIKSRKTFVLSKEKIGL